jgi:polyphosphate kinase 2 (PPK2 family)
VLLIFGGIEGAGKSETVQTLNEWLDPRHVHTHGFLMPTDEEAQRPPLFRFWRALPPKGEMGIFFGSWYSLPMYARAMGETSEAELDRSIAEIRHLERMLSNEGLLILKFWMHLGERDQRKRLRALEADPDSRWRYSKTIERLADRYDRVCETAERVLRDTSTGEAPWTAIDGYDHRHRTLAVGNALLEAMRRRLESPESTRLVTAAPVSGLAPSADEPAAAAPDSSPPSGSTQAATVPPREPANLALIRGLDLTQRLEREEYRDLLDKYRRRFARLASGKPFRKRSLILAFEGSDAAGKGGAIRRVAGALDARLYRIVPVAAPTEEERAQPYLWRFWRQVPGHSGIAIFDRTWYGRVLVERVEGLCPQSDWMRAYDEICEFEEQLVRAGTLVCKFWLQIDKDEQLRRFEEREQTGYKRFKITSEDWRNRERWEDYERAVADLVDRTSTSIAPWTLVEANDKYFARVKVLRTICEALDEAL